MDRFHGPLFLVVLALLFVTDTIFSVCCSIDCCNIYYAGDCQDYLARGYTTSGVYQVAPLGTFTGYEVYCDMTTDGGGWLTFQRRLDGSLDFNRDLVEYEKGFGDNKSHEYWLGFIPLKRILAQGFYELRIDLTDFEGNATYAKYETFDLGEGYKLSVKDYTGTAGDSLSYHNGKKFSTRNLDVDSTSRLFCAMELRSAWWFKNCHMSNLNGQYLNASHATSEYGVNWDTWRGLHYSLKTTDMKIRRV